MARHRGARRGTRHFGAGLGADLLADDLSRRWGQQVIVENRPGLAGTVAVAKAPADGYTLMVTSNGHTVAGLTNKNVSFDPVKDFAGITRICSVPLYLITHPDVPARTLKEVIELAKAKPGTLNFSSPGLGSTTFIAGALFRKQAGINVVHVPYKGAPEAVTAVMRNDSISRPTISPRSWATRARSLRSRRPRPSGFRTCRTCRRSPRPACRSSTIPGSA